MIDKSARDHLRSFVERIERLEEEKKAIADVIRDVYAEAKWSQRKWVAQIGIRGKRTHIGYFSSPEAAHAAYVAAAQKVFGEFSHGAAAP